MVANGWAPKAGDIVWMQFSPQSGHEQAGHRPALVLSPEAYNRRIGLALCVPLTTRVKGYPFEVDIAGAPQSVALADQVRSLDWRARGAKPKGRATLDELGRVRALLDRLIGVTAPSA